MNPQCIDCPGDCAGPCLAAYAPDQQAMREAMDKVRGHSVHLNVVTFPVQPDVPQCDGSYTCQCVTCRADVTARIRDAGKDEDRSSPFRVAA